MAGAIMVQGTMSNVGKSWLVAGLCRVFAQDGFRVSPFKSQNMALNSGVTEDGLEMGRAQIMQAEGAGVAPDIRMNPILLKPHGERISQVVLHGRPYRNMDAAEYFQFRGSLLPEIQKAFYSLKEESDIVVIEGAGSPAEINLKQDDIVNMGLAEAVDAPVILVGDIDRGGVFAQLIGTVMLLEEQERKRIRGLIINKFRGDKALLEPGLRMIEEKCHIPVLGVVPFADISLDDEDSLSERFAYRARKVIDIAVIKLPHISNFTDFAPLERFPFVSVRFVDDVRELGHPSMIVLPGTKNTLSDLKWLKRKKLAKAICDFAEDGMPVLGICGGFQMLGEWVEDEEAGIGTKLEMEQENGWMEGLSLLPVCTRMKSEKRTQQFEGSVGRLSGVFSSLSGERISGYEIHMGETRMSELDDSSQMGLEQNASLVGTCRGNVYGTYVHGLFDNGSFSSKLVGILAEKEGIPFDEASQKIEDYAEFKEREYDKLADCIRNNIDMEAIYRIVWGG